LDPFSISISAHRGFLLENARRYDEAIEQLRRVIAMDPNNYMAPITIIKVILSCLTEPICYNPLKPLLTGLKPI
jgi:hypothetical protein